MKDSILYCFYDLAVAPASYDFLQFMQSSDLHRKRYGLDRVFFIFVPGPKNGFRDDSLSKTTMQRSMMMRNVLIPACRLLPSHVGTVWLSNRDEAKAFLEKANGNIFPRLYSFEQPVGDYLWRGVVVAHLRGESLSPFIEPLEYTETVQAYLEGARLKKPHKIVTVTVRETDYNQARNTDLAEWSSFLKELSSREYRVIIVPDTERVWNVSPLLNDFEHCSTASIDILFRTALYRQAHLNMFVNNGPSVIGGLTGAPTLIFKMVTEDRGDSASTPEWMKYTIGIESGDQFPIFKINHRIAWGLDQKEFLLEQFNQYFEAFVNLSFESIDDHGIQSERQRKVICELAWNYVAEQESLNINNISKEEVDTLEAIIENNPYFAEPKYMLGLIAEITGHLDVALQLFNDCIQISQISGDKELYRDSSLIKTGVLEKSGKVEEALRECLELNEAYPNDREVVEKVSSLRKYVYPDA